MKLICLVDNKNCPSLPQNTSPEGWEEQSHPQRRVGRGGGVMYSLSSPWHQPEPTNHFIILRSYEIKEGAVWKVPVKAELNIPVFCLS